MSGVPGKLYLTPVTLEEANEFVSRWHRHHGPVVGHKFSIGAAINGDIVGVVIVGRPISRHRDDGVTLEVTRLCTLEHSNSCSFLYGAAARAAFAMGYKKIGTYIHQGEGGASLRAAGWRLIGEAAPPNWNRQNRPRVEKPDPVQRLLFQREAAQ